MMRPVKIATAAVTATVLFGLVLAGCGSGERDTSGTAVSAARGGASSAAPASTAAAAAWSIEVAQQQYLAMVEPVNTAIAALNKLQADNGPLSGAKQLATGVADALDQFARDLTAGKWPESAQDEADALIKSTATETVAWRTAAAATSIDGYNAAAATIAPSGDAQAFRVALGLPGITIPT